MAAVLLPAASSASRRVTPVVTAALLKMLLGQTADHRPATDEPQIEAARALFAAPDDDSSG
jgi:hypothetical protein